MKFFCLFLAFLSTLSAERFFLKSELDRVYFLDRFLSEFPNDYKVEILDTFETNQYFVYDPSSILKELKVIYKSPLLSRSLEQRRAYEIEQIFLGIWNSGSFEKSLMFYYNVDYPGRQHFRIKPKYEKYLKGKLFLYSLWIHSSSYRDALFLVFKTLDNQEKILKIGSLNWKGWRRIEGLFPESFSYYPKLNQEIGYYKFDGFYIQTYRNSEVGVRELLLDQFYVILNRTNLNYNGSEILDNF
ncbi:MAG: flagellar filament outer layer protein FlaA [Leptonema sp. (in: bacteria)]